MISTSVTLPKSTAHSEVLLDRNLDSILELESGSTALQLPPTGPPGQIRTETEGSASAITIAATVTHPSPMDELNSIALEPAGGGETNGQTNLALGCDKDVAGVWREASISAGLEGNTELSRAVLLVYQRSTLLPGGHLDLEATYAEQALRTSDSSSSFHTRSWLSLFALVQTLFCFK
jgi:hypothetical protein